MGSDLGCTLVFLWLRKERNSEAGRAARHAALMATLTPTTCMTTMSQALPVTLGVGCIGGGSGRTLTEPGSYG